MPKHSQKSLSNKISKLVKEGYKNKQAVAIAMSMKERGQVGPKGGYTKKKKGK